MLEGITISEFMGSLVREIAIGRAMADRSSVEIAKAYDKDDLLKFFPVPRFTIPEMEVDFALEVVNGETQPITNIVFEKPLFVNIVKSELNRLLTKYGSKRTVEMPEFIPTVVKIDQLYQKIVTADTTEMVETTLKSEYQKLAYDVLSLEMNGSFPTKYNSDLKIQEVAESVETLISIVSRNKQTSRYKLKNMFIKPALKTSITENSTGNITTQTQGSAIINFKLKIKEEAITVETLTDETGKSSKYMTIL